MGIRNRAFVRAHFAIVAVAVLLLTLAAGGIVLVAGPGAPGSRLVTVGGGTTTVPGPTPARMSGSLVASDPPSTLGVATSSSAPAPQATTPKPTTTLPYHPSMPRPTTTIRSPLPVATVLPTTTVPATTIPANAAMVTLEGRFDSNVLITFAGRTYNLAPNQDAGPFLIPASPGVRDTIKVARADDPSCAVTQTAHFFDPGQKYWVWADYLVGGTQYCPRFVGVAGGGDVPQPRLTVNQYPPAPPLGTTG